MCKETYETLCQSLFVFVYARVKQTKDNHSKRVRKWLVGGGRGVGNRERERERESEREEISLYYYIIFI